MALLSTGLRGIVPSVLALATLLGASNAGAAFDCSSDNPADWPPPSRPYFMLAVDTSGSMISCTNPSTTAYLYPEGPGSCPDLGAPGFTVGDGQANSCGLEPTRLNDAKCAMRKTIQAFAGEVNFGLSTYAPRLTGCQNGTVTDSCPNADGTSCGLNGTDTEFYAGRGCSITNPPNGDRCGNTPDCNGANAAIYTGATINGASTPSILGGGTVTLPGDDWRNGGNILVDMLQDPTWAPNTQPATNVPQLLEWFDGRTDNSHEIYAAGFTPLEGILRTVHQYYSAGWSSTWTDGNYCANSATDHPSPLDAANDRPCRSLNVILVTDGDETCGGTATNAASAMAKVGTVIQGIRVPIKTYVIGFAGATKTSLDAIAAAGGTGASYVANNEVQLSQALAGIISAAVSPEVCNNRDDNCNGCTDEGSKKYCDRNKTGRSLAYLGTPANNPGPGDCCNGVRATCLADFTASITAAKPQGDKFWLPCWDPTTDAVTPEQKWLCTDPGEICDNKDNNCELQIDPTKANFATNVVDENQLKCGNPAHCPIAETCDGTDQNCDGVTDNASGSGVPFSVCPNQCAPTGELCNGCDDDCDGIADNGVPDVPCGFSPPAACAGVEKCTPVVVSGPGACIPGFTKPGTNRYGTCSGKGTTETCNGLDDNCDGIVDNNPTGSGTACTPNPGDPTIGACKAGTKVCQNGTFVCSGYQGPTTEICDGIDNDCNGKIDDGIVGVGKVCGSAIGRCTKGLTACVGGAIVCTGGNLPQPEICNGSDDDCNGVTDDALTDAPAQLGCWSNPVSGTCTTSCSAAGVTWCPPKGATCTGVGTLVGACKTGALVCDGPKKWVCRGDQPPVAELCNGQDDNCNGATDEGLGAPFGSVCGQTKPGTPCKAGILECENGAQVCAGQVAPQPEICNGKDDDCDGRIDNGITLGGSCEVSYDTTQYPGPKRQGPQCPPGILQCDPAGGGSICAGGKGPQPEVCDGIDNDCDGAIDESGTAPDGINGSVDPNDPTRHIGDECGLNQGACKPGHLGCLAGRFACLGASGAQPEVCDCIDNDCDGLIDEDPSPTEPALCSTGKTCVQKAPGESCQCAAPCTGGEFPCPGGQSCEPNVLKSGTTTVESKPFCFRPDTCGDCTTKTVKQIGGAIECAPAGSQAAASVPVPVCQCNAGTSCHAPCFGKAQCPTGEACAPADGTCQPQGNCFFFGCPAGQACNANRTCVENKCATSPCPANQVCKPTGDFSSRNCVGSCAGITCDTGQACVDGSCQPTGCVTGCPTGQFCRPAAGDAGTASCGPTLCTASSCSQGEYCDPRTGRCGANPCSGVICPSGQACLLGECIIPIAPPPVPDGGQASAGGAAGVDSGTAAGGSVTGTGAGPNSNPKAAFGLATGGGGCACSVPSSGRSGAPRALLLGLVAAMALRARRRSRGRATGGVL